MSRKKCKKLGKKLYNIITWLSKGMGGAMKTNLPMNVYPKTMDRVCFNNLLVELSQTPADEQPDISVTYQVIGNDVRVLAVGSFNGHASDIARLLQQHPDYAVGLSAKHIRSPETISCFY